MKKDVTLTLGVNSVNVIVDIPDKVEPRKLTEEEIREMNESWERCHFQMSLD